MKRKIFIALAVVTMMTSFIAVPASAGGKGWIVKLLAELLDLGTPCYTIWERPEHCDTYFITCSPCGKQQNGIPISQENIC